MSVFNVIVCILAIFGMADVLAAIIVIAVLTRKGDDPHDDRHREEDEEQMEYLRRWREGR